ncbi:MAG: PQQ-dependent sugar dehydrogenase [Dehalococcoidia bacterium]
MLLNAGLPRLTALFALAALVGLATFAFAFDADAGSDGDPEFETGRLNAAIVNPTSLAFGPDGRLYVASLTGVHALSIDPATKALLDIEEIASGLTDAVAIAFDLTTPPEAPVTFYISHRSPIDDGLDSKISRVTGPDWQMEDVITGLPNSRPHLNHLTNGLAFDEDGRLFIAQGSSTDAGLTNPPGMAVYWPETPLSAAILVVDIHAPDFDGNVTYDQPGPPADHTLNMLSGDIAVYATGVRNPFDLVLHSNGHIYATDNGAVGQEVSLSCTEEGGDSSTSDELNLIEEGNYYGFPNRNRGRFDERECTYRAPEDGNGADFTAPIAILPSHCSCDGIVEYTVPAFGGAMLGDLIYVEFIRSGVSRAVLSEDGRSVESTSTIELGLNGPLDVTVANDGTIYVTEFNGNDIFYLQPAGGPFPTATPTSPAAPTNTPTHTPTSPPPGLPGDANCSGDVSSIDAALVLQLVAALIGNVGCPDNADVNGDGRVDAVDAALILQMVAGLI